MYLVALRENAVQREDVASLLNYQENVGNNVSRLDYYPREGRISYKLLETSQRRPKSVHQNFSTV